jgi:hypothetical protein
MVENVQSTNEMEQAAAVPQRVYDGMEKAILAGKVVDQNFRPLSTQGITDAPTHARILSSDEQKAAKGELKPGDIGWIRLDEQGRPTGTAQKFPIKDGPSAPVATIVELVPTDLATPAGAFLTDGNMNPSPAAYKYHSSAYRRDYAQIAEQTEARRKQVADARATISGNTSSGEAGSSTSGASSQAGTAAGSSSSPTQGNPLSISKLSKENPSKLTLSATDYRQLAVGNRVRFNGTNVPAADGQEFTLASDPGTNVFKVTGLDLSENGADVTTGTVTKIG